MKTMLVALTLTVLPTLTFAMGCSGYGYEVTAMSCAEGMTFDTEQQRCIPVVTG